MNRTKRKIFETAMKLFAEKGYSETSIEEITAVTGIAKGTLYYHFSKKEDILNFLIEEGMKLLKNSIEIKTNKSRNTIEKIKAIILIQIKVTIKYENLITLILSQMWGKEKRNISCKNCIFEYMNIVEKIVKEGIKKGEILNKDSELITSKIFATTFSSLVYELRTRDKIDIEKMYNDSIEYLLDAIKVK